MQSRRESFAACSPGRRSPVACSCIRIAFAADSGDVLNLRCDEGEKRGWRVSHARKLSDFACRCASTQIIPIYRTEKENGYTAVGRAELN